MKKKILLGVLLTLTLICLFAFSISAVEIDGVHYTLKNGETPTAEVSKDNATSTTTVVLIPETVEYEGVTYKVTSIANSAFNNNDTVESIRIESPYITSIPHSFILNTYNGALRSVSLDFTKITRIETAGLNSGRNSNGNDPEANSIYFYDLNGNKVTDFDFPNIEFIGYASCQGVNFDKIVIHANTTIGVSGDYSQLFRKSTAHTLIVKGERTKISNYEYAQMPNLKSITIESKSLTSIGANAFASCPLVEEIYIDFSNCTYVGGSAFIFAKQYDSGSTTAQWYNLEGEKIIDLSNLKTISGTAFASANIGSAKIIWPKSLDSIGDQCFRKCNISQPMYINASEGKTLTVEYWAMNGNSFPFVVLGKGVTTVKCRFEAECTVVALGDTVNFTDGTVFNKSGSVLYCKAYTGTDLSSKSNVTVNTITDGSAILYAACGLVANVTLTDGTTESFNYVNHEYTGVADETVCPSGSLILYTCAGCKDTYEQATDAFVSKEHNFDLENGASVAEIIYINNNYFANGSVKIKCAGCDASNEDIEIGALFTAVGYSENEVIGGFISHTIKVNLENMAEYERLTGITVRYGLVAALHKDGKPIYLDGDKIATVDKAYSLDMTNTEYSNLLIKVNGITDARAINCNAFAVINGEITYLCGDTASSVAAPKSLNILPEVAESISCEAQAPESKQYA